MVLRFQAFRVGEGPKSPGLGAIQLTRLILILILTNLILANWVLASPSIKQPMHRPPMSSNVHVDGLLRSSAHVRRSGGAIFGEDDLSEGRYTQLVTSYSFRT